MRRQPPNATPVSLYRLLLYCYPTAFREEFGDQMADFFRDQYRETRLR